jgi:hypothetical protein
MERRRVVERMRREMLRRRRDWRRVDSIVVGCRVGGLRE